MSIGRIQREFFNGINAIINPRLESQEEAIEKCSDQTKSLFIKGYFSYGEPRKVYNKKNSPINLENKEIPLNHKEQIIHIISEVEKGNYKSLNDVKKDYPYMRYKNA